MTPAEALIAAMTEAREEHDRESLEAARRAKARLASRDCEALREQIVDTARAWHGQEIWLGVFDDDADMVRRLEAS